jgi:hypothetical protein
MMIDRDRAWRRRKARTVLYRTEAKKEVLRAHLESAPADQASLERQHRHGALTPVQAMRQQGELNQQLNDGLD